MSDKTTSEKSWGPHGSARYSKVDDIEQSDLFWSNFEADNHTVPLNHFLRLQRQGHLLTVGSTRSGKGIRQLIPSILAAEGISIVVYDPKGEIAGITHGHRERLGIRHANGFEHNVFLFNPWHLHGLRCDSINPFSLLDPGDPDIRDDAAMLADLIVTDDPKGEKHWTQRARQMVTAILVYMACHLPRESCTPITLWQLLRQTDSDWQQMVDMMRYSNIDDFDVREQIQRAGNMLDNLNDREMASIRSAAQNATDTFSGRAIRSAVTDTDLDLRNFTADTHSVYLMVPLEKTGSHQPITRLVLSAIMKAAVKYHTGNQRTVFYLDEFTSLGHLEIIEQAYASYAGLDITVWPFIQNIRQLHKHYPDSWTTFLANAEVATFFGINDLATAQFVSDMAGTRTVWSENRSTGENISQSKGQNRSQTSGSTTSRGHSHGSSTTYTNPGELLGYRWFDDKSVTSSYSQQFSQSNSQSTSYGQSVNQSKGHSYQEGWSQTGRPLIMPEELMTMGKGKCVIFANQLWPISLKNQKPYWDESGWSILNAYPTFSPNPTRAPEKDSTVPAVKKIIQSMGQDEIEHFNKMEKGRQEITHLRQYKKFEDGNLNKIGFMLGLSRIMVRVINLSYQIVSELFDNLEKRKECSNDDENIIIMLDDVIDFWIGKLAWTTDIVFRARNTIDLAYQTSPKLFVEPIMKRFDISSSSYKMKIRYVESIMGEKGQFDKKKFDEDKILNLLDLAIIDQDPDAFYEWMNEQLTPLEDFVATSSKHDERLKVNPDQPLYLLGINGRSPTKVDIPVLPPAQNTALFDQTVENIEWMDSDIDDIAHYFEDEQEDNLGLEISSGSMETQLETGRSKKLTGGDSSSGTPSDSDMKDWLDKLK